MRENYRLRDRKEEKNEDRAQRHSGSKVTPSLSDENTEGPEVRMWSLQIPPSMRHLVGHFLRARPYCAWRELPPPPTGAPHIRASSAECSSSTGEPGAEKWALTTLNLGNPTYPGRQDGTLHPKTLCPALVQAQREKEPRWGNNAKVCLKLCGAELPPLMPPHVRM